jgi:hypothetical protein
MLNSKYLIHRTFWPEKSMDCLIFNRLFKLWRLNGVKVPKEIVMTPASELNPKLILTEKNVQVRREILRKIGLSRFLSHTKHKVLDEKFYVFFELCKGNLMDKLM